MRQRLATQSAQSENDQLAAFYLAMRLFKFGHCCRGQRLQRRLRQMRIRPRNRQSVAAALNQLHAERKAFFAYIIANDVERGLIIGGSNPALHRVLQCRHVAGQMHGAGVDQCIEIAALAAQIVGQSRRVT